MEWNQTPKPEEGDHLQPNKDEYFGPIPNSTGGQMGVLNLQQVSSGIWSDLSYDYNQLEDQNSLASMENNRDFESDYDFDTSEGNGSESVGGVEEEEDDVEESLEEDDEEDNEDDDDQVADLIDNLEVKFKHLVFSTIDAAEQFLDDANIVHLGMFHSSMREEDALFPEDNQKLNESQKLTAEDGNLNFPQKDDTQTGGGCHVGVQTEEESSLARSSGTLVAFGDAQDNLKIEQAEAELTELESLRESLISELGRWRRLLRKREGKQTEQEFKEAGRTICQIQESLDAIDEAIRFKQEIIGGATAAQAQSTDGMEFSKLVTNLHQLSTKDLQNLMGVYFTKTVELRHSTLQLEQEIEDATVHQEDLSQRLKRKTKQVKELEEQHQTRILEFLCKNTDPSYYSRFRRKEEQLQAARKRQDDLEKSLTVLLVRHGYLLDGVDYDVRQVVRTLGIDETQIAAVEQKSKGRTTRRGGISSSTAAEAEMGQHSNATHATIGQVSNDNPKRPHHQGRHLSAVAGPSSSSQTAEVRREKGRLVIQPGTSSGAGSSSANQQTRHHHPGPSYRKGHH